MRQLASFLGQMGILLGSHAQVAKQEAQATQAALRRQKARLTAGDRAALLGEAQLAAGPSSSAPQLAGRPDVSGIAGMICAPLDTPCF